MDQLSKLPTHVSIIMDGNGRWAKERGLERFRGHIEGVESVRAVTEVCSDLGIPYLSLFAFSQENWNRPDAEVSSLMKLMFKAMSDEVSNFMEHGVKFVVLGDRSRLSDGLNEAIDAIMQTTAANDKLTFIIFMSYSGKWDILQAARKMAVEHPDGKFDEQDFTGALVTSGIPDPDLIIRTSGEQRISNYLLWQTAYSELYFTPVFWPDFRKEQFFDALKEYERRDRRFGKVK